MDPGFNLVEIISQLGSFGVLVLLAWRTFSHTIPRIVKSQEESSERARIDFKEMLKDERDGFREMLQSQRADFRESLAQHKLVCKTDLEKLAASVNNCGK